MKVILLGILVLTFALYIPQVDAQEKDHTESDIILPPLKQIQNGVEPESIQCKKDLNLMFKVSDNSPVCLTWETRDELFTREIVWVGEKYIKIDTDKQRYNLGEVVQIIMINPSKQYVDFPNSISFQIRNQNDKLVAGYSYGKIQSIDDPVIPPLENRQTLYPNDQRIVYWNQTTYEKESVKAGSYSIITKYFVPWKQDAEEFMFPIENQTLHHFEILPERHSQERITDF